MRGRQEPAGVMQASLHGAGDDGLVEPVNERGAPGWTLRSPLPTHEALQPFRVGHFSAVSWGAGVFQGFKQGAGREGEIHAGLGHTRSDRLTAGRRTQGQTEGCVENTGMNGSGGEGGVL